MIPTTSFVWALCKRTACTLDQCTVLYSFEIFLTLVFIKVVYPSPTFSQVRADVELQVFLELERILNIPAIILALLSLCQNILLLVTLKIKTSIINMFHLSSGTSSIFFFLVIILNISFSTLYFLQYFLHMSLIVSISFSTLISLNKTISLALPFIYSTIITHKSTMKITSITWILAGMLPTPVLMNIQTKTCRTTILTLQSLARLTGFPLKKLLIVFF